VTSRWVIGLLVASCKDAEEPPPSLTDTGWFTTTPPSCDGVFLSWAPETGTSDWSWRGIPTMTVSVPGPEPYQAWIEDALGVTVAADLVWAQDDLSVSLVPTEPLAPSSAYDLVLVDCVQAQRIPFSTSAFGMPIVGGPSALVGPTWLVDLASANWVEPAELGLLFTAYVDTPLLMGVTFANAQWIDVLAAQATIEGGQILQDPEQEVWAFPTSDFTDAPFFSVTAPRIVLVVPDDEGGTVQAPIESFHLEGTFAADGTALGGVVLTGLADTRGLGPLFQQPDNPRAACDAVEELGSACVACGVDPGDYCLAIRGVDLQGVLVPGLVLQAAP
jgi:hypothetical protein